MFSIHLLNTPFPHRIFDPFLKNGLSPGKLYPNRSNQSAWVQIFNWGPAQCKCYVAIDLKILLQHFQHTFFQSLDFNEAFICCYFGKVFPDMPLKPVSGASATCYLLCRWPSPPSSTNMSKKEKVLFCAKVNIVSSIVFLEQIGT